MTIEVNDLENKPRIVIAKNQNQLMDIFRKFPTDYFTQHQLHVQTQIQYPASVHSALTALQKKGKIERHEAPEGTRISVTYKLSEPHA